MKRRKVSWSNFTDFVEGPCVVCQREVQIVIPYDRPDPAILYHATCDPVNVIRTRLKNSPPPPLLPKEYTVKAAKAS